MERRRKLIRLFVIPNKFGGNKNIKLLATRTSSIVSICDFINWTEVFEYFQSFISKCHIKKSKS